MCKFVFLKAKDSKHTLCTITLFSRLTILLCPPTQEPV